MAREPISVLPDGFDAAFARLSGDEETAETPGSEQEEANASDTSQETEQGQEGQEGQEGLQGQGGQENDPEQGDGGEDTQQGAGGEDIQQNAGGEDTQQGDGGEDADPGAGEDTQQGAGGEDTQQGAGGDDPVRRLAELLEQQNAQKQGTDQQQGADQQQTQQQQEAEPELYTADEKKLLETYEQEWPEVSRAEELKRRAEYHEIVKHVFNEVAQQMAPVAQMVQTLSERTHVDDLRQTVGEDYDTLRDEVVEWVKTQPSYLQSAYQHVIDQGTVDEVADLVERFRAETGKQAPASAQNQKPSAKQAEKPKKAELPEQTKKAAASLAPVSTKRGAVPQGEEPTDFESAFDKFASRA